MRKKVLMKTLKLALKGLKAERKAVIVQKELLRKQLKESERKLIDIDKKLKEEENVSIYNITIVDGGYNATETTQSPITQKAKPESNI